jgi:pimeloyl-ACP methyl ester carboxylesterase
MPAPVSIPDASREQARIRRTLRRLLRVDPKRAGRIAAEMFITPMRYPVSPKEQAVIDAAPVHTPLITRRGKDFVLHQWDGDGPRVLLVHGWEQTAGRFVALIQALQKAGYAVAALDAPAHGASGGEKCGMADFMDAAQASIRHLGGVHGLVGHSLGGSAVLFALSMLEGVTAKRVVTIGAFDRVQVIFDAWIHGMGLPDDIFMPMVRRYKETYGVWSPDFVAEKHAPKLDIPALIIHDRDDDVIPFACGEKIAALWPESRFMATDRLRHYLTLRNAEVVKAVVDFVGEG